MLDNPLINICIGLSLLYLLLSIITTTIQEIIAGFFDWRGNNLMKAIDELIVQPSAKQRFFLDPLIFPLFKGGLEGPDSNQRPVNPPAYIPSRSFALALLRSQKDFPAATSQKEAAHQTAVLANVKTDGAAVVLANSSSLYAAGDDTLTKQLELLYDSTMERAAGWYKRRAMYVSLVIGLLVSILLNADSINIARQLWNNSALRAATTQAAETILKNNEDILTACVMNKTSTSEIAARITPGSASGDDSSKSLTAPIDCSAKAGILIKHLDGLTAVGFPLGWTSKSAGFLQPGQQVFSMIVGILLTTVAIGLGSNFWFDTLNRFMNLRSTGKREETANEKKPDKTD